ncbi:MAG: VOC family protein [Gemmatimonadetes bacterium]|nr:VOC family protein [Gemmatimonadota bacterium]
MSVTLHSIAIFVHDIDKALKFYNHQLGLPVGKQGSFGFELLETRRTSACIRHSIPMPRRWWGVTPGSPSRSMISSRCRRSCSRRG